jgi:hypothetical protein
MTEQVSLTSRIFFFPPVSGIDTCYMSVYVKFSCVHAMQVFWSSETEHVYLDARGISTWRLAVLRPFRVEIPESATSEAAFFT